MRTRAKQGAGAEAGMSLIELMISMVILAVGLSALATLFFAASATNSRNQRDTTSVMVSKMVLEAAMSQHINSGVPTTITDCQGNVWTIAVANGPAPNGSGALLDTNAGSLTYGQIDRLNQTYGAVPAGYAMKYMDCNGSQYDVRWNSMTVTAGAARMITVSTQLQPNQKEGLTFTRPTALRGIAGP